MKRILTHTVLLLLIVLLLPVCPAEARRYDFKVLPEEECPKLSADGTYFYVEGPSGIYSIPDYVPVEDDTPRNHIEEYDWLDPKYQYASKASCGRIFVSEQPLPDKLEAFTIPDLKPTPRDFMDSLAMDLTLMDLQGNVILDGLQSDVFWSKHASYYKPGYDDYHIKFRESRFAPTGIACVKRDGKYGIIDTNGNILFDFSLNMWQLCEGYLGEQGYVIADINSYKIIFDPYGGIYADFRQVQEQYGCQDVTPAPPEYNTAIVHNRNNYKYGVVDTSGKILVPFEYHKIKPIQKNVYRVENVVNGSIQGGLYNIETQTLDWWEGNSAPYNFPGHTYFEKNTIKSVRYRNGGNCYYNEDFELVCECKDGSLYDAQGNIIEGTSYELGHPIIDGINVYTLNSRKGLIAINEIPEPQATSDGHYICMMLGNPLINIDGEVSTIVENNYFFSLPLENDRTLVPMRIIFEALGAQVEWDGDTQTVTATKEGKAMRLQIDKNELYIGDEMIWLDAPPRLIEGRTLVPLRAVSECFGAAVEWDGGTQLITVTWK